MKRTIVIVALFLLAAVLPLAALPVLIFVLAAPLAVAGAVTILSASAPPLAPLALLPSRAPPSR